MDKMADYLIKGDYIFNGRKGVQIGEVSFYEDGKLLGRVEDKDFYCQSASKKVLIGLYAPSESLVSFVKFPLDERLMPVMWTLTSETMHCEEKPMGRYSGFWEFLPFRACQLPFPEFQGISEDISRFENVSYGLLNALFFNDINLKVLEDRGSFKSQKGKLEFIEF